MNFQKWFALGISILITSSFSFPGNNQQSTSLKGIYITGKIEFVPVLKITKESVPVDIPFKGIYSICRIHDRLYVLDTDCSNIKVFTADGRFLKTFGKEGSSESELNVPNRMNVIDGQLVVWEIGTRRFSVFNADGVFRHTLQPFKKGFADKFVSLGNGNIVIERTLYGPVGDEVYKMLSIELYSKNFQLLKVLYQKQFIFSRIFKTPGNEKVSLTLPFRQAVSWDILPGNDGKNTNKVVIGCSEAYSIDIIDTDTDKSRTFTHPYSPVKVIEADRVKYFESFDQYDKDGNITVRGADQFMRDNTTFPETKPVFKRLIVDYEGNILVFTYSASDNGKFYFLASEFDAFDADGQFINHVKIANDVDIFIVRLISDKDHVFWGQSYKPGIPVGITKYTVK
jgi:hypothetical protein